MMPAAFLATVALATSPAHTASILERCTVWPWVVDVCWSRVEGIGMRTIHVVAAPMSQPPDPHDYIPEGAMLLRGEVFPATRFDEMTPHVRRLYSAHYRAFLLWRRATTSGLKVDEFIASPEYDESEIASRVAYWEHRK